MGTDRGLRPGGAWSASQRPAPPHRLRWGLPAKGATGRQGGHEPGCITSCPACGLLCRDVERWWRTTRGGRGQCGTWTERRMPDDGRGVNVDLVPTTCSRNPWTVAKVPAHRRPLHLFHHSDQSANVSTGGRREAVTRRRMPGTFPKGRTKRRAHGCGTGVHAVSAIPHGNPRLMGKVPTRPDVAPPSPPSRRWRGDVDGRSGTRPWPEPRHRSRGGRGGGMTGVHVLPVMSRTYPRIVGAVRRSRVRSLLLHRPDHGAEMSMAGQRHHAGRRKRRRGSGERAVEGGVGGAERVRTRDPWPGCPTAGRACVAPASRHRDPWGSNGRPRTLPTVRTATGRRRRPVEDGRHGRSRGTGARPKRRT
ncbi:hypothetical protein HRbin39_00599 [bacterium HR39]|nr:hypothetical protein HRbin39_00599 [bacterium HR39]